jgi:hypothetical protein
LGDEVLHPAKRQATRITPIMAIVHFISGLSLLLYLVFRNDLSAI